ncbi:uncharacterized protein AFUA_3G00175 [Aspergillus fumigatus Af293]|uniref:Cyanovirin-N domain-containing protein n=2 Tax=Aspergillus fumigatus TaxID=746128 RepID=A4D9Y6_ASPFU|nr:hypothetical protein AFUA_3G00175 [Aspergillus fumigatus Af293]EBA27267.1 hypothetical protein AFUA_3G00175 [Aspergillus fumigatus Af293]EDP53640.1 hypothetical protein AFUB_048260 [Aspergillus fumigatus A1163]
MKIVFPALLSLPIGALAGSAQWCHIVNSDVKVNCRAGPHLNSRVVRTLSPGENLYFGCYKRGDCYKDNCTWDHQINPGGKGDCYVNGYFTDNHCTMGNTTYSLCSCLSYC